MDRIAAEARERSRAEAETRVWEKANAVQRAVSEAATKIITNAEAERGKRDRE